MSSFRFWTNSICCFIMVACFFVDVGAGQGMDAAWCAVVAAFTGLNAYLEKKFNQ